MADYTTPGVYIQEIPSNPPSVVSVPTAIPVFIGYTEKAILKNTDDLLLVPQSIESMVEYEQYFGGPLLENITVTINTSINPPVANASINPPSLYQMNYALQLFFANGGGQCYIVSTGNYSGGAIQLDNLQRGLSNIETINGITLIVFPDALNMANAADYYNLQNKALNQCGQLQDRFVIMDVFNDPAQNQSGNLAALRNALVGPNLKYGAAYFPQIRMEINCVTDESKILVVFLQNTSLNTTLDKLKSSNNDLYLLAQNACEAGQSVLMSSSPAVAGAYVKIDSSQGVWKAPANINLNQVARIEVELTDAEQQIYNEDPVSGISVNVIRSFPGKGNATIWGASTLAGNDNDWRYIPVKRFFMMVEQSLKNAANQFVFEPNDENTWVRIQGMIETYLTSLWRQGSLAGAKPKDAFFVKVGLGVSMSAVDVMEGRMIIILGLAQVRPAEFIILEFTQLMQQN